MWAVEYYGTASQQWWHLPMHEYETEEEASISMVAQAFSGTQFKLRVTEIKQLNNNL